MNKFKDDKGRWRTQSLFLEQSYGNRESVMYTMRSDDHPDGYQSFSKAYMAISDPTEYRVANELLGGWEHWQVLCSSKWFGDYVLELRAELEVKLRSEANQELLETMKSGGQGALQAAKHFSNADYKPKRKPGRPSKEEIEAEAKIAARVEQRVLNDAERLGLNIAVDNTQ